MSVDRVPNSAIPVLSSWRPSVQLKKVILHVHACHVPNPRKAEGIVKIKSFGDLFSSPLQLTNLDPTFAMGILGGIASGGDLAAWALLAQNFIDKMEPTKVPEQFVKRTTMAPWATPHACMGAFPQ